MPVTEAELRRRLADGTLVDWLLRDPEAGESLPTDPVSDALVRATLATVRDTLATVNDRVATVRDTLATVNTGVATTNDRLTAVNDNAVAANARLTSVEAGVATTNDRLATVRDTVYRRTDPLPPGGNIVGFVSPSTAFHVGQARFFLSSTGRMTLTAAGNFRFLLQNPATSGKTVYLARLAAFTTVTGWASVFVNPPVTGHPIGAPRPASNAIMGHVNPAAALFTADTSALVPLTGADSGIILGLPGGARTSIDLPPLVLAPGVSVGCNVPYASPADVSVSLYWYEA